MDLSTSYTIKAKVTGQNQIGGLQKGLGGLKTSTNNATTAMNKLKSRLSNPSNHISIKVDLLNNKEIILAIKKAKEILQEAQNGGIVELEEDALGEEVKVKRPAKNPPEVKLPKLNNTHTSEEDRVNEG